MKTAILISGHMRSFDRCLPTLHWHVFRHFPNADFFVSTEPDADAPKAELLRQKYPDARVEIDLTPQPRMHTSDFAGASDHAPYAISVPQEAVLGQLWRLNRNWEFAWSVRSSGGGLSMAECDTVIRCRPDLWFESGRIPVYRNPPGFWNTAALTPWWGRFGGCNDRFALLGRDAARAYFTTWSQIRAHLANGCPLHPESLIRASLEAAKCVIDDRLDVSFSTLRANGERRFPEITAQDIAHMRTS